MSASTAVAIEPREAERAALLFATLARRFGRGDRTAKILNEIQVALHRFEADLHDAVVDVLADHYPDAARDEHENVVAEILAVRRGE